MLSNNYQDHMQYACELADFLIRKELTNVDMDYEGVTVYTDEAQDLFERYYDSIMEFNKSYELLENGK